MEPAACRRARHRSPEATSAGIRGGKDTPVVRSTRSPVPVSGPKLASQSPEQLRLRFFAVIGAMKGVPPERALWRELLNLALGTVPRFEHRGRSVAAAIVHHVALALYMRAGKDGIVGEERKDKRFSVKIFAADCRLDERTIKVALAILRSLRVVKMERTSRRAPARWRMNLGGLDWPAVRERARASGGTLPPLSGGTLPPLKGYDVGLRSLDEDHDRDPLWRRDCAHARCGACRKPYYPASGPECPHCRFVNLGGQTSQNGTFEGSKA